MLNILHCTKSGKHSHIKKPADHEKMEKVKKKKDWCSGHHDFLHTNEHIEHWSMYITRSVAMTQTRGG